MTFTLFNKFKLTHMHTQRHAGTRTGIRKRTHTRTHARTHAYKKLNGPRGTHSSIIKLSRSLSTATRTRTQTRTETPLKRGNQLKKQWKTACDWGWENVKNAGARCAVGSGRSSNDASSSPTTMKHSTQDEARQENFCAQRSAKPSERFTTAAASQQPRRGSSISSRNRKSSSSSSSNEASAYLRFRLPFSVFRHCLLARSSCMMATPGLSSSLDKQRSHFKIKINWTSIK